jgi:membrane protein YqaA with SNARE-associated domain
VYEKLSVTDLRAEIQNRGLSCKAEKKADLVDFLKSHDHESETPSLKSPSTNESGEKPTVSSEEKKKVKEESFEEVDRGRLHAEQMKELRKIVLWRKPLTTLLYFVFELRIEVARLVSSMLAHKITMVGVVMALMMFAVTYYWDGPHQSFVSELERQILWCSYWVGLGILSSVGLGTGLHTFLLYLGPHIASVTLAAWSCMSLDFPEPPYPSEIHCPSNLTEEASLAAAATVSVFSILYKVKLEAFMWGAGTAIGELPPYFMARAARMSGQEEEEFEELEEELHSRGILSSAKRCMHNFVQKVGFFGILLAASIPNPLFDLAGITCGHFLVPFWTFFGATLIGKAVFKMLIQTMFTIVTFSKRELEFMMHTVRRIPYVGVIIEAPFEEFLEAQKKKYLTPAGEHVTLVG